MTIDEKLKKSLGNRNPAIIRSEKMILKLMKFRNTLGFHKIFLQRKAEYLVLRLLELKIFLCNQP